MKFVLIFTILVFSTNLLAKDNKAMEHKHSDGAKHTHAKGHKMDAGLKSINKEKALIQVQGMVCAFCAQGIEKNFKKRKEVESVKVDLDKMEVLVHFKKGLALPESEIKKIVTGAGFQFKGIKNE